VVDVHLFDDAPLIWIVLVDKTSELEWQTRARQSGNELRLLQQQLRDRKDCQFEFFEALNMMALRLNDDGTFDLLKPVAESFALIYPEAFSSPKSLYPQHKFPFIENFLIDAEELWAKNINHQRISSGPWIEALHDNAEIALEATAINWESQKLLFIQIMDASYQQNHNFLQIGREGVLLKNLLEQEVRKRTAEIRSREEEIALRLICAADSRDDGETGSHIRRLGLYSELMAKHLDWRQDRIDEIRIAAPMHDIGKIGIPDSILKKPGKLTAEEYEIMKTHSEIGAKILSNSQSPLVKMAREISLGHHERWDGTGYPKGLSGKQIPISARIVAIADVFDALIHKRVYKKEMSIDDAIQIMQQGRGSHFDPKLFDLFIELKQQMSQIATRFEDPRHKKINSKLE
jgi:HD-GYP domain-containing protein (c-di-GMP phosphodiesterase class II)